MLTLKDIEKSLADQTSFHLSADLNFADGSTESKLLSAQIELLLDKPVQIGGPQSGIDGVEFSNNAGCSFTIRTCREYRAALTAGYYALTTFAMKMECFLASVDAVLRAVSKATSPQVSYVSNPHFGVSDVDLLPTTLLPP